MHTNFCVGQGSIYHMKIDPGVNIPWGSKYQMTPVMLKCKKDKTVKNI